MIIVQPSYRIEKISDGNDILLSIEKAGRTCYKSEDKISSDSSYKFVKNLLLRNPPHLSVIEHESMTIRFVCNRGFTHELVRHRLVSFSQESTRYVNYSKGKYGGDIQIINQHFENTTQRVLWMKACRECEDAYMKLISSGVKPESARSVLPICLKTEIVATANMRQWGHILYQRISQKAHPQMRELMVPLWNELRYKVPLIFDNLEIYR